MRARANVLLIASLILGGALPVLADSVSDAIKSLHDRDPQVRVQSRDTLVKAGAKAVGPMVAAMTNRNRLVLLSVMSRIGRPLVPALIEQLDNPEVRSQAGEALFQLISPADRVQIPVLVKCFQKPEFASHCGRALDKIVDAQAQNQVPALTKALKSRDAGVRLYAVLVLSRIGRGAAAAKPALKLLSKDSDAEVRRAAKEALKKV